MIIILNVGLQCRDLCREKEVLDKQESSDRATQLTNKLLTQGNSYLHTPFSTLKININK